MTIEKRDVTFKSADNLCSGWFFLPQRANADMHVPAIAMAHGVGAVKEMYIDSLLAASQRPEWRRSYSTIAFSARAAASRVNASSLAIRWKTIGVR